MAQADSTLISEPITPDPGRFDPKVIAAGQPSCPGGFTWCEGHYAVVRVLDAWKESSREGARAQGDLYVRRHYFKVLCDSGDVMTIYCSRKAPRNRRPQPLWRLYTISYRSQIANPD